MQSYKQLIEKIINSLLAKLSPALLTTAGVTMKINKISRYTKSAGLLASLCLFPAIGFGHAGSIDQNGGHYFYFFHYFFLLSVMANLNLLASLNETVKSTEVLDKELITNVLKF